MVHKKSSKNKNPNLFTTGLTQANKNNVNEVAQEISKAFRKK
ncbi:MAG: hypothetical protein ACOYI2_03495 [Bacillota bacterium]|jgi:hypothetical protein